MVTGGIIPYRSIASHPDHTDQEEDDHHNDDDADDPNAAIPSVHFSLLKNGTSIPPRVWDMDEATVMTNRHGGLDPADPDSMAAIAVAWTRRWITARHDSGRFDRYVTT